VREVNDAPRSDGDEPHVPFTYDELRRRRRDRPLRELPSLTRASIRLVRRAAPRELRFEVLLSIAAGVFAALQLVFTRQLLQRLLQVDDGRQAKTVVWPLVGFIAVVLSCFDRLADPERDAAGAR